MTIPLWCLIGGIVLPYLWAGVSVPFRNKELGSLDLVQPRLQALSLTGGGAGAWGAQMNQWEAVTVFFGRQRSRVHARRGSDRGLGNGKYCVVGCARSARYLLCHGEGHP